MSLYWRINNLKFFLHPLHKNLGRALFFLRAIILVAGFTTSELFNKKLKNCLW